MLATHQHRNNREMYQGKIQLVVSSTFTFTNLYIWDCG